MSCYRVPASILASRDELCEASRKSQKPWVWLIPPTSGLGFNKHDLSCRSRSDGIDPVLTQKVRLMSPKLGTYMVKSTKNVKGPVMLMLIIFWLFCWQWMSLLVDWQFHTATFRWVILWHHGPIGLGCKQLSESSWFLKTLIFVVSSWMS